MWTLAQLRASYDENKAVYYNKHNLSCDVAGGMRRHMHPSPPPPPPPGHMMRRGSVWVRERETETQRERDMRGKRAPVENSLPHLPPKSMVMTLSHIFPLINLKTIIYSQCTPSPTTPLALLYVIFTFCVTHICKITYLMQRQEWRRAREEHCRNCFIIMLLLLLLLSLI